MALDERPPLECMLESLDRILSLAMDFPNDGKIVLCFLCLILYTWALLLFPEQPVLAHRMEVVLVVAAVASLYRLPVGPASCRASPAEERTAVALLLGLRRGTPCPAGRGGRTGPSPRSRCRRPCATA